jgi:hypothetical protein
MKLRFLLPLLFAIASTAQAATVNVVVLNYSNYAKGMICVVDAEYQSQFESLYRADSFNTERTDRNSALKLMGFFKDVDQNACYNVPTSGTGKISVPDRDEVYIVTTVMTSDGSKVYWNITSVEGTFDQVVTVDAP